MGSYLFDRDISWLSFNERVLREAQNNEVPIGERFTFLAIYSSNSDEFFRVRIPVLMGLHKISRGETPNPQIETIKEIIEKQQQLFGQILQQTLRALRSDHRINLLYGKPIPEALKTPLKEYFFNEVMAFLQPVCLSEKTGFFPENNKIYFAVSLQHNDACTIRVVNIPSDLISRFYSVSLAEEQYIVLLDDIIAENMKYIFPGSIIRSCHSFKVTRDAELDLKDEYEVDIAEEIEKQLLKRDMGLATRFLYDTSMPGEDLGLLIRQLNLKGAGQIAGGRYHNLKDLAKLPLGRNPSLFYNKFAPVRISLRGTIFERMEQSDFMLHTPYQSYDTVLRFFNEAALDQNTSEIYVSLYRLAHDSHIAQALISAARNGKKVTVFVELKARFDEANNIHWAKKMKAAGAKIIYSIPGLKVHAKVALVKRKKRHRMAYYGLLGTGNFNENTARVYSDHILFTTHRQMLSELELLFLFFNQKIKNLEDIATAIDFHHLIISQFNMLDRFTFLIDEEIRHAKNGAPSAITIQLNNLEDPTLIGKLYEASVEGVTVRLIVRGICRLVPGVKGMSENITVRRIVDRYLEHGRIFVFHHGGQDLVFCGSADWMSRNIYRRIEACFPVYDPNIKDQLKKIVGIYLSDNTGAVTVDDKLNNVPVEQGVPRVQAQQAIYQYLSNCEQ